MRSKFTTQMIAVAVIATLGLTGCKGFRWPWQSKSGAGGTGGVVEPLGGGTPIVGGERPMITGDDNLEHGLFQAVLFAYDSAAINKSTQIAVLKTVAEGLKANPKPLLIEGHADERGTAEYNRALGEKRALACREYLVRNLGVSADRITTISYGKERPADTGHNEAAWAKNRRCEFALVGK